MIAYILLSLIFVVATLFAAQAAFDLSFRDALPIALAFGLSWVLLVVLVVVVTALEFWLNRFEVEDD